jgi:hypothetical protein
LPKFRICKNSMVNMSYIKLNVVICIMIVYGKYIKLAGIKVNTIKVSYKPPKTTEL